MEIFYKLLESAKADKINGIDRKMRLLWLTIGREPQFKPLSYTLEYAQAYEDYFQVVAKDQSRMNLQERLQHTADVEAKVTVVLDLISKFCTKNKKKLKVTTIEQTKDIDNLLSHS